MISGISKKVIFSSILFIDFLLPSRSAEIAKINKNKSNQDTKETLSSAPDPAVSIAVTILALLLALTGFGLWTAFGPKAAKLTDPWDDHDD